MPVPHPHRTQPRGNPVDMAGGFTLIELMVTLAVLAVIIAITTPLFAGVINSNRLTSNANELVAALQIARTESIRNNARAVLCESDNGSSCTGNAAWRGWIVSVDSNRNGIVESSEILKVGRVEAPTQMLPSSNITNSRVVFRADGMAYDGNNNLLQAVIRVCLPVTNPPINVRDLNIAAGSRVAIKRATAGTGGACPAPGNT